MVVFNLLQLINIAITMIEAFCFYSSCLIEKISITAGPVSLHDATWDEMEESPSPLAASRSQNTTSGKLEILFIPII